MVSWVIFPVNKPKPSVGLPVSCRFSSFSGIPLALIFPTMRISRQLLFRLASLLLGVHIFITGGRSAAQDLSSITWGIELTATTDRNDASDVGAPVDGKIMDFPRKVAEAFAKEVGSVVIEDNRSLKDRAHQVLSVKTANGIWKFHNDHGSVEAVSPILSTAQIGSAEAVFFSI